MGRFCSQPGSVREVSFRGDQHGAAFPRRRRFLALLPAVLPAVPTKLCGSRRNVSRNSQKAASTHCHRPVLETPSRPPRKGPLGCRQTSPTGAAGERSQLGHKRCKRRGTSSRLPVTQRVTRPLRFTEEGRDLCKTSVFSIAFSSVFTFL